MLRKVPTLENISASAQLIEVSHFFSVSIKLICLSSSKGVTLVAACDTLRNFTFSCNFPRSGTKESREPAHSLLLAQFIVLL